MRRKIGPDGLVRGALQLLQGLLVHLAVKIDRHEVRTEMEADVLIAKARVDEAGDEMLTGVLLHEVQPPRPVDLARHVRAGRQSCRTAVQHRLAAQERLRDVRAAERARVAGLAASRGIKDRAVQLHEPAVFALLAGEHARLQLPGVRVRFIDADRVQGFPLRFSVFFYFTIRSQKTKGIFPRFRLTNAPRGNMIRGRAFSKIFSPKGGNVMDAGSGNGTGVGRSTKKDARVHAVRSR